MEYTISLLKILQSISIILILILSMYYIINIGNKYVRPDKKFTVSKKNMYSLFLILIIILIIYNIINGKQIVKDMILSVIYAIILSYVLNPVINFLESKGIRRNYGIIIIYLILILTVVIIGIKIIPKTYKEFENLIDMVPVYANKAHAIFDNFYSKYISKIESLPRGFDGINKVISENIDKLEHYLLLKLREFTKSIVILISQSFKLIIVPILSFYFLQDKEYFKNKVCMIIPKKYRDDTIKLGREINLVLNNFVRGQVITSVIVGLLTMIGLLIIKLDFAIIISLIVGLFEVVPYFGPVIGAVLAVVFGLLESPSKAIWGLVVITLIQQLESNIISPKIVGESVGIHPAFVILIVIIGGGYFGVLGMLLAIPVSAIIKILSIFILEKMSEQR